MEVRDIVDRTIKDPRKRDPMRIRPSTLTVHLMADCDLCQEEAEECFWGLYYKVPEHDEPMELDDTMRYGSTTVMM